MRVGQRTAEYGSTDAPQNIPPFGRGGGERELYGLLPHSTGNTTTTTAYTGARGGGRRGIIIGICNVSQPHVVGVWRRVIDVASWLGMESDTGLRMLAEGGDTGAATGVCPSLRPPSLRAGGVRIK